MSVFSILPTGEPDAAAGPVQHVIADADHGFPCRRCLRDARTGDELLLLGYDPFPMASPYTGRGPIYVHAGGCEPHADDGELPPAVRSRGALSVRGYDADGMLTAAAVLPPQGVRLEADAMLDAGAAFVHVHVAGPGCFLARVDRGA